MHEKICVFVLGNPADTNVVWPSQTIMADKLREAGVPVTILKGTGVGPEGHRLPNSARIVAGWCASGLSTEEIIKKAATGLRGVRSGTSTLSVRI